MIELVHHGESSREADTSQGGEKNEGTLIPDANCAPQNIRFPTDASLLNEAWENAEEVIDILHAKRMTDGKKREEAPYIYFKFPDGTER